MKTAAVFIEKWKLPIFSRHLREAGYSYDTQQGITHDGICLKVEFELVEDLQPVVQNAQNECAKHPLYRGRK